MARVVRTTVALPSDLIEAADRAVQQGKARSRNDFVAMALRRELAVQERAAIDAAFELMANDSEGQSELLAISEELGHADWEALAAAETTP